MPQVLIFNNYWDVLFDIPQFFDSLFMKFPLLLRRLQMLNFIIRFRKMF
jgi:hypothetical protein